ncbi:MAG: hypothetical protein IPO92_07315 [Saprospiraceae bacterium]|nr:hypothetical protein [Saprospiraceae bacterium]
MDKIFLIKTSFSGNGVLMKALIACLLRDYGCIIAGIENGGASRLNEYSHGTTHNTEVVKVTNTFHLSSKP